MYQVVFDQCPFYLIFNPVPVYSLVCELVIGDEYYSLCNAILLDISVYKKYCWEQGVIGSREDCAVVYLSSRHSSTDVFQGRYDCVRKKLWVSDGAGIYVVPSSVNDNVLDVVISFDFENLSW